MILDMPQYNLRVRCRENQDKERLAVLANNKKIQQRMIDSFPHPYTVQDAAGWITTNKGKKSTHFAIVDAENMVI